VARSSPPACWLNVDPHEGQKRLASDETKPHDGHLGMIQNSFYRSVATAIACLLETPKRPY
jgi:hypothetical protein